MTQYKWEIAKTFNWEGGHRVHNQSLTRPDLSLTTVCACKNLHGHSYKIKVHLGADELGDQQMVLDFKNLEFMKQFVDDILDHKFMIDINDPNFELITGLKGNFNPAQCDNLGDLYPSGDSQVQLHRGSFVIVDFVPTSENIAKFIFEYAKTRLSDLVTVVAVELWETEKSYCRYTG